MVYITGDIHGDPRDLLRFSEAHSLTADDTIIILGDTGFNFYLHGRDRKAKKLRCYASTATTRLGRSRFPSSTMKSSASVAPS